MLDPLKRKLLDQAKVELEEALRSKLSGANQSRSRERNTVNNASRASARVRISPTVAADYQARNVFPDLRPSTGKAPGRYFAVHEVPRAVAQAVYDDAVEQAARGGSLERRSLTLAYNALARRALINFGDHWLGSEPGTDCQDPGDFRAQAPVVDALLRTASQMPNQKP